MIALYEMTIFLAIALIAIVATVFVIAASLLGRAIEESSRQQEEKARKQSSEFDEIIAGLQQKLKAAKTDKAISDLQNKLDEYKRKRRKAEKDLKRISQKYGLLTVKGTVLYPAIFFLVSLVLAGAARYFADFIETVPLVLVLGGREVPLLLVVADVLWCLSLVALIWGAYRIYKCLKVIEDVAITTEEAQFKRTTQALEMALERHKKARHPELKLEFTKGKPPFNFKPGVGETIEFGISLEQADVAQGAEAWFFAPEGFEFPGSTTVRQKSDYIIPNALTTILRLGNLKRGISCNGSLTIKTPLKKDEYSLGYRLTCEGSPLGELERFKIKVE